MTWLHRVIIFGFFRILKFLPLIDSSSADSWKTIFITVMHILLCRLIFVLWTWERFTTETDGRRFSSRCFAFWTKCFLSFCAIKFTPFYRFMKNTYYDSSHIDAINFFEHTSEFSFCVFFVFEHSEAKSSIWIDPCITFCPDKTHVRIRKLYKLAIVANSDIMTTLAFHLLFSRPSNAP